MSTRTLTVETATYVIETADADGFQNVLRDGLHAGLLQKVDGNNRRWTFTDPDDTKNVSGEEFRSAKAAIETFEANRVGPRNAPRKVMGRNLLGDTTMVDAIEETGDILATIISETFRGDTPYAEDLEKGETPVSRAVSDMLSTVADHEVGADDGFIQVRLAKLIEAYREADRDDRADYVVSKVVQATGRALKESGFNRRTGLPVETEGSNAA